MSWTWIPAILGALLVYEFGLQVALRKRKAGRTYREAEARARATGKPLVVVGDPDNGLRSRVTGRDYGCGDLCIDLTGCPGCPKGIAGDAVEVLSKMEDDSAVVFIAYVFECVEDPQRLYDEANRVAGGDLFFVTVSPWSPAAYLHPRSKWAYIRGRFVKVRRFSMPYGGSAPAGPAAR